MSDERTLYRINPEPHDDHDGSYTGDLPDPISFLVDDGVLVPVEPTDRYAVLRTDGEDIDHEYSGYFQHGLQDAREVASVLGEGCDGWCDCEFAVYALVQVPKEDSYD